MQLSIHFLENTTKCNRAISISIGTVGCMSIHCSLLSLATTACKRSEVNKLLTSIKHLLLSLGMAANTGLNYTPCDEMSINRAHMFTTTGSVYK